MSKVDQIKEIVVFGGRGPENPEFGRCTSKQNIKHKSGGITRGVSLRCPRTALQGEFYVSMESMLTLSPPSDKRQNKKLAQAATNMCGGCPFADMAAEDAWKEATRGLEAREKLEARQKQQELAAERQASEAISQARELFYEGEKNIAEIEELAATAEDLAKKVGINLDYDKKQQTILNCFSLECLSDDKRIRADL